MPAPSRTSPSESNADRTTSSPSTDSSTPQHVSMFTDAKNTLINNSSVRTAVNYTTVNNPPGVLSLDILHKSVAPNAILNAGGRADEVRCYPGTREEVIGLVKKSITQQYTGPRMLWLSGPAGAGKSAIMQTVAEQYKKEGVPHANFFFFRADGSRKDAGSFVATIMHQIIQRYPSLEQPVAAALTSNPLIFQMGIQEQFDVLLHQALATIQNAPPSHPPLALLIDGLDECDSDYKTEQRQLLEALDTLLTQKGQYFRVVVASRVEPQISMAFSQLRSQVDSIFLDEKYSPEKDIRRFVTAEFDKIKSSHYLASTLGPNWPSESDVAGIVSKSSGQFIFAATVMRFISHSPASPILSLQKVQGIVPPKRNSPFALLDAVYAYIVGQVEDWEAAEAMLGIRLLNSKFNRIIPNIMMAYQPRFSKAMFDSCLSELAPLVSIASGRVDFFHASFPDFLRDQTRSREYHVDLERFCTGVVSSLWRTQRPMLLVFGSVGLAEIHRPTSEITAALMERNPDLIYGTPKETTVRNLVYQLCKIYTAHDFQALIKIVRIWSARDCNLGRILPEDLRHYAAPVINSDMPLSVSQMPTFNPQMRQLNHQTPPFIHRPHSSVLQTPPSTSWTHASAFQAHASTFETHPPSTQTDPFQFSRQEHSATYQTNPPTSRTYSPTGQTYAFIPQMSQPISPTHQHHHHQLRSSTQQAYLPTFQTPPSTFSTHQPTSRPHLFTSQVYSSDTGGYPFVWQTPPSTDQSHSYNPSFAHPYQ